MTGHPVNKLERRLIEIRRSASRGGSRVSSSVGRLPIELRARTSFRNPQIRLGELKGHSPVVVQEWKPSAHKVWRAESPQTELIHRPRGGWKKLKKRVIDARAAGGPKISEWIADTDLFRQNAGFVRNLARQSRRAFSSKADFVEYILRNLKKDKQSLAAFMRGEKFIQSTNGVWVLESSTNVK
ncbi:MAG TPA: hypothetical protein VJH23_04810, partial [archaeon]|nr:hypothetical protein [archaeon]